MTEIKICDTTLICLYGVGPIDVALILGEVGDVPRFLNSDHLAS